MTKEERRIYNKEYKKKNKEKIKEYQMKYQKEYQKEYYKKNKEKIKERTKEWCDRNKVVIKEYYKEYYENNKLKNKNLELKIDYDKIEILELKLRSLNIYDNLYIEFNCAHQRGANISFDYKFTYRNHNSYHGFKEISKMCVKRLVCVGDNIFIDAFKEDLIEFHNELLDKKVSILKVSEVVYYPWRM